MREKAHCYRKFWRKPITIHKLGKGDVSLTFSKGVEIRQLFVGFLILLILLLFKDFINPYIPGMFKVGFYVAIPFLLSGWIFKSNKSGKRMDRYFFGLIRYSYNRKYSYSSGKAVYRKQLDFKQSYSQFKEVHK